MAGFFSIRYAPRLTGRRRKFGGRKRREAGKKVAREVGTLTEFQNVVQLSELTLDLIEPGIVRHKKEHGARGGIGHGNAKDGFEIEGPAGEESGDMGHDAGVIADTEFEDDGRHG